MKYAERRAGIMSCLFDKRRFLCRVKHIEMAGWQIDIKKQVSDLCWLRDEYQNLRIFSYSLFLGWLLETFLFGSVLINTIWWSVDYSLMLDWLLETFFYWLRFVDHRPFMYWLLYTVFWFIVGFWWLLKSDFWLITV